LDGAAFDLRVLELLEKTVNQPALRTVVSNSVLAPKPFSGAASEDPEALLEYF
jgi:hypothetical protein